MELNLYNILLIVIVIIIIIVVLLLFVLPLVNINNKHPHKKHKKIIGGCKGTRYGCCSDGVTPKGGLGFLC